MMSKKVKEVRALITVNDRILAATTFDGGRVTCDLPRGLVLPEEEPVEAIKRLVLQVTHYHFVDIEPVYYCTTFTRMTPGPVESSDAETVEVILFKGSAGIKESVYHSISKACWLTPRQLMTELNARTHIPNNDPMDEYVLQHLECLL